MKIQGFRCDSAVCESVDSNPFDEDTDYVKAFSIEAAFELWLRAKYHQYIGLNLSGPLSDKTFDELLQSNSVTFKMNQKTDELWDVNIHFKDQNHFYHVIMTNRGDEQVQMDADSIFNWKSPY